METNSDNNLLNYIMSKFDFDIYSNEDLFPKTAFNHSDITLTLTDSIDINTGGYLEDDVAEFVNSEIEVDTHPIITTTNCTLYSNYGAFLKTDYLNSSDGKGTKLVDLINTGIVTNTLSENNIFETTIDLYDASFTPKIKNTHGYKAYYS